MVDPNNGWAVGWNGEEVRWDGTRWNNVTSPTKADLKSIDMVNSDEGYATAIVPVSVLNESVIRWTEQAGTNVYTPPKLFKFYRYGQLN